jgi:hypothetical protein
MRAVHGAHAAWPQGARWELGSQCVVKTAISQAGPRERFAESGESGYGSRYNLVVAGLDSIHYDAVTGIQR